jgi:hypothetical protein
MVGVSADHVQFLTADIDGDGAAELIQVWDNGTESGFLVHKFSASKGFRNAPIANVRERYTFRGSAWTHRMFAAPLVASAPSGVKRDQLIQIGDVTRANLKPSARIYQAAGNLLPTDYP